MQQQTVPAEDPYGILERRHCQVSAPVQKTVDLGLPADLECSLKCILTPEL